MRSTIFLKFFCGYFVIILLFTGLVLIFTFVITRQYYIDTISNTLLKQDSIIQNTVKPLIKNKQIEKLNTYLQEVRKLTDSRITIVLPNGAVIADSDNEVKTMENHSDIPEIARALKGEHGKSIRYNDIVKQEMLSIAVPIIDNKKIVGVLRTTSFIPRNNVLFSKLKNKIFQITIGIILLSLLLSFIFSKKISSPIKELLSATKKVAEGKFDTKIYLHYTDELKTLAESFNYMSAKMNSLFNEMSLQKEELANIITSIQEGLIVLDNDGKIILANKSFEKIVNRENIVGKHYLEILRDPAFNELVKMSSEEKSSFKKEIELNNRTYVCSVTKLFSKNVVIFILHDITELKNLQQVKKDFVTNVSHELRTPLTAIKGFVETLEIEEEIKNKNYLEIIKKHTDRLINIVQDLLLLAKLEQKDDLLRFNDVNLRTIIEPVTKIFYQKIKEKGLQLKLDIQDELKIKADEFQLEQMFINLIDNAIKYTETGEINISCSKKGNTVQIEIRDTGIGIPKEDIERIFERFYVVNKSRSRKLGGTGLGLSIVKHIVLLHNGSINVESSPGNGTKFIITLPV